MFAICIIILILISIIILIILILIIIFLVLTEVNLHHPSVRWIYNVCMYVCTRTAPWQARA